MSTEQLIELEKEYQNTQLYYENIKISQELILRIDSQITQDNLQ
jgi:hypothetical protein